MMMFEAVRNDCRYAARSLRRAPGFTTVVVVTLALGIGANCAIFSMVDAVLLRPLPFSNPDRLVMLWERTPTSPRGRVATLNLIDWQARNHTFDVIAGFIPNVGGMVMGGPNGGTETIPRQWVTPGMFDALGVKPIVGRAFRPDDARQRANVVVLSEAFWRARFNADPGVVGRVLQLDGDPWTVVGVAPNVAQVFGRTGIWALLSTEGAPPAARAQYVFQAIGRLKAGVTREAANDDMASVADALAREFPNTNTGRGVVLEPLRDAVIGSDLRQTSTLFLGVVGFVLLISCASIANLLLARATARRRELALR
jgi:putative ABC transport system permease protein